MQLTTRQLTTHLLTFALAIGVVAVAPSSAQHNHAAMMSAGAKAMGFDQTRTFHHFRLLPNGGTIEVHANDPADRDTSRQIAMHLQHIATMFGDGDFNAPFVTHGEEPPGVSTLKRLKDRVRYRFIESPVGGRVRIETDDADALAAVHAFLRYQIREHRTGDPTEIEKL
jgi:hypothetical protein